MYKNFEKYVIGFEYNKYKIVLRNDSKKDKGWAIFDPNGNRYHIEDGFHYEPSPSNRDEEYITKSSFTFEMAVDLVLKFDTKWNTAKNLD